MKNGVLIADNVHDEALLGQVLRLAGLNVRTVDDVRTVSAKWSDRPANLLLIASELSDPVGTVHDVRRVAIVPLILLVDAVTEANHCAILDAGATSVVVRPYSARLLISYTKVLMRSAGTVVHESLPQLSHDEVVLDPGSRTVKVEGKRPQRLSQLEFRLLHSLMAHQGQVLPTETIVEHVWGYTGEGDRTLVHGLVNRLRMKIETDPHNPQNIVTIPGVGYSFGGATDFV